MASEELVEWVGESEIGSGHGSALVSGGSDDEAMDGLDAPILGNEFSGEPIEELGVGWWGALGAVVVFRFDQTRAKILLPDAVDHHASSERVGGIEEPARQIEPIGWAARWGGERRQDTGSAGGDLLAGAREVALDKDDAFTRLRELDHDERGGGFSLQLLERREFFMERGELGIGAAEGEKEGAALVERLFCPRERERVGHGGRKFSSGFRRGLGEPSGEISGGGSEEGGEVGADLGEIGDQVISGAVFRGEGQATAGYIFAVAVIDRVVEEGIEPKIIFLRQRVEFMVVALSAIQREAEERTAKCGNAIHHGLDAKLLRIDAALLVNLGVAVEAGGDFLC